MNSESSSAAAEVTKIHPKLLRRLFYVWIVIAPMVIYELHYEYTVASGTLVEGMGYVYVLGCVTLGIYFSYIVLLRKLILRDDGYIVKTAKIPFSSPSNAEKSKGYMESEEVKFDQISLVEEIRCVFWGTVLLFDDRNSKEKHLLWVSGWRHSKRLKEDLIQSVLQNNGEYEKVRLWKYLTERVLAHRGQSEASQPCPHVPFTKRLTAAISKALDAIKAQFMSR